MKTNSSRYSFRIKNVLSIIIIALMVVSCEKDKERKIINQGNLKDMPTQTMPRNSLNPFDSVGIVHNNMMSLCSTGISAYCASHDSLNIVSVDSIARNILFSNNYDTSLYTLEDFKTMFEGAGASFNSFFTNLDVNSVQSWLLKNMMDGLSEIVKKDGSYGDIYDYLVDYESEILANNKIEDLDKEIVLIAASVLRHSTYYWITGRPHVHGMPSSKQDDVSFWTIVASDFAGAVNGACLGAATGSAAGTVIQPGAGTTVGATLGGIIGGIVGGVVASHDAVVSEEQQVIDIKLPEPIDLDPPSIDNNSNNNN